MGTLTMSSIFKARPARALAVIAFALLMLNAFSANATHQVHHRYTVWGAIKYEDGSPAAEIPVHLMIKDGEPLGEVKTDRNGRYRIILHVHNDDLYKIFDMRVNNVTRKVRLLFTPGDHQTERGQRIDLVVKREGES